MNQDERNEAEAEVRKTEAEAKLLEARAKLHPLAQLLYTFLDGASNFISNLGCLIILAIIVIALFAPGLLQRLFGGG